MPRRQYRKPPIQEAVCEIRFAPAGEWNVIYPLSIYERVRNEYSSKPRQQKLVNVVAGQTNVNVAGLELNEITRLQFLSEDGRRIMSIAPDLLSVSVMRPYPGWEEYQPAIHRALAAYAAVVNPVGVRRLAVRYINQIEYDGDISRLPSYVRIPLPSLNDTSASLANFMSRHEYVMPDMPIRIAVATAQLEAPQGKTGCLLDIELFREWPGEVLSLDQVPREVDTLRDRQRPVFESFITEDARTLFDAA